MKDTISIEEAVVLWVNELKQRSAFFESELMSLLGKFRDNKSFRDKKIRNLRRDANLKRLFQKIKSYLVLNEIVKETPYGYLIICSSKTNDLEIVCSLYPTGYISYSSAMRYYNLIDKSPKNIDFVALPRNLWKEEQSKVLEDNYVYGLNIDDNHFITPYPSKRIRVKSKYLNIHSRTPSYQYELKDSALRVISIGDLFLEMLRYPELCGGFQCVLEIYEEMGRVFLEEIIESVEQFGNHIDKCRIGFVLQCHLGIDDERVIKWQRYAPSRGGSRKMVSKNPYSNNYNEVWCISLNDNMFKK